MERVITLIFEMKQKKKSQRQNLAVATHQAADPLNLAIQVINKGINQR